MGNPTIKWPSGGSVYTRIHYGYDNINRLSSVHPYQEELWTDYYYDWVGNPAGYTANEVDQLVSPVYTYDPHYGNLSSLTYQSGVTTYEYDNYNLLKKIIWSDETNTQFVSDSAGNRVSMTTSQGIGYNFIYDTTAGIPAVLMEQEDSETPKLYIRTPDGRLIARITATASPTLDFYYHFDGLGSTLALTDSTGTVTDRYTYDAWGIVSHSGLKQQPYQFVGQLGYYTHYQDPKLQYGQMLQLGVRYYMPGLGRFTQRDSVINVAESSYIYASDSPLSFVDPEGTWAQLIVGGLVAVLEAVCLRNAFEVGDPYRGRDNALGHQSHFMAHCMAACRGTRCVPSCGVAMLREQQGLVTLFAGGMMEIFQSTPWGKSGGDRGWGNNYWRDNMSWNVAGVACGVGDSTCFQCCYQKAKKDGLL